MMVGDTLILYNRSTRTDGRHTYIARSTMGMMAGDTFILYNRSTHTDGRHTYIARSTMGMMVGDVWSLRGIWLEEAIGSSLVPS